MNVGMIGLIPTGRSAEEVDHGDLLLHRVPEPAIIRRVGVGAHERVVDDIIACIDLVMRLPLIVIPDPPASPGEHGSDGQQVIHLPGLEDPALRVQESYALAVDLEPRPEISGIENPISLGGKPAHTVESRLS